MLRAQTAARSYYAYLLSVQATLFAVLRTELLSHSGIVDREFALLRFLQATLADSLTELASPRSGLYLSVLGTRDTASPRAALPSGDSVLSPFLQTEFCFSHAVGFCSSCPHYSSDLESAHTAHPPGLRTSLTVRFL